MQKSFAYGLYNAFDTLGRRRQQLLRQRDPTTAATDVGGVTLPPASTATSGGGQGRPGRTLTDGCPGGVPRASAVPISKHPYNPKSVFCCMPIAIQLQAGLEQKGICQAYARHMPGLGIKDSERICQAYARHKPDFVGKHMSGI